MRVPCHGVSMLPGPAPVPCPLPVPNPPAPEPLPSTVLGPTGSRPPLCRSQKPEDIPASAGKTGCPTDPGKRASRLAAAWRPCSLPLSSLRHLSAWTSPELPWASVSPVKQGLSPLHTRPLLGMKGAKVPWGDILRGGCHLGVRFTQRPGDQGHSPPPPWSLCLPSAALCCSVGGSPAGRGGQGRGGLGWFPRPGAPCADRSVWFGLPGSGAGSASGLRGGVGVFGLTL